MVSPLSYLHFPLRAQLLSRGGMKESGIGRENGVEAFEACKDT